MMSDSYVDSEVILHEICSKYKEDPCQHCVHFGNFSDVRFDMGLRTYKNVVCDSCEIFNHFVEK